MSPQRGTIVAEPVDHALARADEHPDDSGYGRVMFLVFIAAVLLVTFTVCVLAVVGSWWMLGVTVVIQLSVTAIVLRVVYGAFKTSADADEDSVETPPQTMPSKQPIRAALVAHH